MNIGVVHLVRRVNGISPFESFLSSYAFYQAGEEHQLIIVFKGFHSEEQLAEYKARLAHYSYLPLFVGDTGFDIEPYLKAANTFKANYFCFLNSYSVIQSDNWLSKLYDPVSQEGVGIVGATASYESVYSTMKASIKYQAPRPMDLIRLALYYLWFAPFPNYHIRTNGFMIARSVLCRIKHGRILRKIDAMRFESGKNSLTRQIMNAGLEPVIVGQNGQVYERTRWQESKTYAFGEQENLLITDNRTTKYSNSCPEVKKQISRATWGNNAFTCISS